MRQWVFALVVSIVCGAAASASGVNKISSDAASTNHAALLETGRWPLRGQWRVRRSKHFIIARHTDDPQPAVRQARLLELTYTHFYRAFHKAGFQPRTVRDPMVAVCFADRAAYLRYARRTDEADMSWTVAYYSARTNRIAFYGRRRNDAPPQDAASPLEGGRHPALYSAAPRDAGGEVSRRRRIALASTTHEAAHQLAFNSGLQRRGVIYPLWACEGLATNFEFQGPFAGFGPDDDNPMRRRSLLRAARRGELRPLTRFVRLVHPPTEDPHAIDIVYAQAWGLFHFLYQHHPRQLRAYLTLLRQLPEGQRNPDALRAGFIGTFGPLAPLSREWRTWVARLGDDGQQDTRPTQAVARLTKAD